MRGNKFCTSQFRWNNFLAVFDTNSDITESDSIAQHTPNAHGLVSRGDWTAIALITIAWLLPTFFIGLNGQFPLNDDFAYAIAVRERVDHGQFVRDDWTYVPLITHTVIGSTFSYFLGFSHETLRIAGFFMGWVGIVGFYTLFRWVGAPWLIGLFAALVIGFNPVYFNLSYTFMTDVPFTALFTWSMVFLAYGINSKSLPAIIIGTLLASATTLSRQFGLAIPLGFAAAVIGTGPLRPRRWVAGLSVSAFIIASYLVVPKLAYGNFTTIGEDHASVLNIINQPKYFFGVIRKNFAYQFMCIGISLAPLTVLLLAAQGRAKRRIISISLILTLALGTIVFIKGWRLPWFNIVYDTGLGPFRLLKALPPVQASPWIWWLITITSVASGAVLLTMAYTHFWPQIKSFRPHTSHLFLAITIAIYLGVMLTKRFDRYLLPVIPIVAALILIAACKAYQPGRTGWTAASLLLAAIAAAAILGNYDYFQRNRTRWAMLNPLREQGVKADRIDGGFEFNGWYQDEKDPRLINWEKGFWVIDNEFVISFASQRDGYEVIDQRTYYRLLPPGNEQLTLFKRVSP